MKRVFVSIVGLLATLSVIPNTGVAGAQTEPVRPNILLIMTDDQRPAYEFMPQMRDWFGDGGRRYPNATVSTPLCCPSRASFLTGRFAHNHGVTSNTAPSTNLDPRTWVSSYLQGAGYRTGIFGKLMNSWNYSLAPHGFDEWAIYKGGYYDENWNINGVQQDIHTYSTHFIRNRALDFLRDAEQADDQQPWLLYMTPYAPHVGSTPEPKYADARVGGWDGTPAVRERDRSDKPPWLRNGQCDLECGRDSRRRQLRSLMSVDDMVGAVRDRLEELGETNTLAIYSTDNGYMWGDHGLIAKGQPYTHPQKIPFFVRWPGRVPPGVVSPDMVQNIDFAPTALDAAGITQNPELPPMDGRSLFAAPARSRILTEFLCKTDACDRWASTRTATYQYIERYDASMDVRFREYYDLVDDPHQNRNLLHDGVRGNAPPNLGQLKIQLFQDRRCEGASCP